MDRIGDDKSSTNESDFTYFSNTRHFTMRGICEICVKSVCKNCYCIDNGIMYPLPTGKARKANRVDFSTSNYTEMHILKFRLLKVHLIINTKFPH